MGSEMCIRDRLTQEGIVYTLDFELIQIDQLQERLKQKLKDSPGLKLVIQIDPELSDSLGAVAKQLATAAGVLDVQLVASGEQPQAVGFKKTIRSKLKEDPPPGSPKSRRALVTGPDGRGLSDVVVKAFIFNQKEPVWETKTDGGGYFFLPDTPPGEEPAGENSPARRGYYLEIVKPKYIPWQRNVFIELNTAGEYSRHNFAMRKATVVTGKVLGVNGNPLPGAQVHLHTIVSSPGQKLDIDRPWATTNSDGSFRFENVMPGKHLVQLQKILVNDQPIDTQSSAAATVVETSDYNGGNLVSDEAVLDLSKSTASLALTLLDEQDQPVPDTEIDIVRRPTDGRWGGGKYALSLHNESYPKVATDSDGKAKVTGIPPGDWEVRVEQIRNGQRRVVAGGRLNFTSGNPLQTTLRFFKPPSYDWIRGSDRE